jgi:sugar phosphate isomerase/epimerase
MNILFHTIAIEPERWTPKRVSRPLTELLAPMAAAGFRELEIYEPHLGPETVSEEIRAGLEHHGLQPVILSSYLNPAVTDDRAARAGMEQIAERVSFYGFAAVRIFPGIKLPPADTAGVAEFVRRVAELADLLPGASVLLETHDGSIADDPRAVVRVVADAARPNIGLLFQPTSFGDRESILRQFEIQRPHIRHLHLQDRNADMSFARMGAGVVPWRELFAAGAAAVDATLEFVPSGICEPGRFDLARTIGEASGDIAAVRAMAEHPA